MQYSAVIRQKDQYEVKWFIPLVELSLEDKLESPGTMTVFTPQCESKKYHPSQKKLLQYFRTAGLLHIMGSNTMIFAVLKV